MLEKTSITLQQAIGGKLTRDIFSRKGILLVSASTIMTHEHMLILEKHGISLTSEDIVHLGPYLTTESFEYEREMDDAVMEVRQLFDEVRETKKVPLAELRQRVIPVIHDMTQSTNLLGLFSSLQAKDDYTYRHNIAVGVIANLLGHWMGCSHRELLQLTTAAMLHDIGKMLIPQYILNKPDPLTQEEYIIMKNHTVWGYEILKETVGITYQQALVALQHHERLDGSGYPLGLKNGAIDLFSRIVSIADVFHAMTSRRVYRDPSPFYEVLSQMEKDAFGSLDPSMTRLFIEKLMNHFIGHSVLLTDGSKGTILKVNAHDPTHPLIQIEDRFIDLSKDFSIRIQQIG